MKYQEGDKVVVIGKGCHDWAEEYGKLVGECGEIVKVDNNFHMYHVEMFEHSREGPWFFYEDEIEIAPNEEEVNEELQNVEFLF